MDIVAGFGQDTCSGSNKLKITNHKRKDGPNGETSAEKSDTIEVLCRPGTLTASRNILEKRETLPVQLSEVVSQRPGVAGTMVCH